MLTYGHGTHLCYRNKPDSSEDCILSSGDKTAEGVGIGDVNGDWGIDFGQGAGGPRIRVTVRNPGRLSSSRRDAPDG